MTKAWQIWNRACFGDFTNPRKGDSALHSLISAHGLVMNGGVLHAMECLSKSQLADAISGYEYFGLESVAHFLRRARSIFEAGKDLESHEQVLDLEYASFVPDDQFLNNRFEEHLKSNPADFADL